MPTVTISLPDVTDGDSSHVPNTARQHNPNPTVWLEKLATLWMKDRNEARPNVTYILDRLPAGYAVFERDRTSRPSQLDRWLYGHPSHRTFYSPNQFYPHFLKLMQTGSAIGCTCEVCTDASGKNVVSTKPRPRHTASSSAYFQHPSTTSHEANITKRSEPIILLPSKRKADTQEGHVQEASQPIAKRPVGRPKGWQPQQTRFDEEGVPDVYRTLIDQLKEQGSINEIIDENYSLDWRAESESLKQMLSEASRQQNWVPRCGEIVLFHQNLNAQQSLQWHAETSTIFVLDHQTRLLSHAAQLRAGVVTQLGMDAIDQYNLSKLPSNQGSISTAGFKIEMLPDPSVKRSALPQPHVFVSLRGIVPFILREYVDDRPLFEQHVSTERAKACMASFTLIGKLRFYGTWPSATLTCQALYLGSELICLNDIVRLLPNDSNSEVHEILRVTNIMLRFSDLDRASTDDQDDGHPYQSRVLISGKCYTQLKDRSNFAHASVKGSDISASLPKHSIWYPLHDSGKSMIIPVQRILGRVLSAASFLRGIQNVYSNLPNSNSQDQALLRRSYLALGRKFVIAAREYAHEQLFETYPHDPRSKGAGKWFWADTRSEALGMKTVNDVFVARHDRERNTRNWKKVVKLLDHDHSNLQIHHRTSNENEIFATSDKRYAVNSPQSSNEVAEDHGSTDHGPRSILQNYSYMGPERISGIRAKSKSIDLARAASAITLSSGNESESENSDLEMKQAAHQGARTVLMEQRKTQQHESSLPTGIARKTSSRPRPVLPPKETEEADTAQTEKGETLDEEDV